METTSRRNRKIPVLTIILILLIPILSITYIYEKHIAINTNKQLLVKQYDDLIVIKEKDYIKKPKENGYRSYHIIFSVPLSIAGNIQRVYVEIQIRTIAMDFWSSLEHEMKYKKNIKNQEMIVEELKRCANEIATTDINMMAIRNMINKC